MTTWQQFGLRPSDLRTIKNGGYYTVKIFGRLRIIVLNNNDGQTWNIWMLYSTSFVQNQLQWLHDTLLAAERKNERVHIVMHVPPGSDEIYRVWSREYARILERFSHIIAGQFIGHTHFNEFNVAYDRATAKVPISSMWNAGSVTPFELVNPNHLVYLVNPDTYEVEDVEVFYFDLDDANRATAGQPPKFKKLYSFKEHWKLVDLSPASLDSLVERWSRDVSGELQAYWKFKGKIGRPYLQQKCGQDCLLRHLCEIVTTEFGDNRKCKNLRWN